MNFHVHHDFLSCLSFCRYESYNLAYLEPYCFLINLRDD